MISEKAQKPTVSAENQEQNAVVGSSVTLHCIVSYNRDQYNVRWFREHNPLPENSRVDNEYLHLYNILPEDAGRYFCEVPFGESSSSDYINLNVQSKKLCT